MTLTMDSPTDLATLRAAHEAARVVFAAYAHAAVADCWRGAETLLQAVLQRPELTGQALVGEARLQQRLSLPDAHALMALSALADGRTGPAQTEAERIAVREAWMALQHALPPAVFEPTVRPGSRYDAPPAPAGTPGVPPSTPSTSRPASSDSTPPVTPPASPSPSRRRRWRLGLAGAAGLAAGALTLWWFTIGRVERRLADAVAAYQRGAREVARQAFADVARRRPADARPLIYLGRMAREEGDLAPARRFLTAAVRVAPSSAIAQRELASAMLADGQPDIARRFYVHALELDPTDRVAQGFLACALYRLQRYDEAERWQRRAGAGDWQRCVGPRPASVGPMPGARVAR